MVAEESPHPFQAPLQAFAAGGAALAQWLQEENSRGWALRMDSRQAEGRGKQSGESQG